MISFWQKVGKFMLQVNTAESVAADISPRHLQARAAFSAPKVHKDISPGLERSDYPG
jgi:hypothetical protein